jgi:uncharacterized protein with PIN domain
MRQILHADRVQLLKNRCSECQNFFRYVKSQKIAESVKILPLKKVRTYYQNLEFILAAIY